MLKLKIAESAVAAVRFDTIGVLRIGISFRRRTAVVSHLIRYVILSREQATGRTPTDRHTDRQPPTGRLYKPHSVRPKLSDRTYGRAERADCSGFSGFRSTFRPDGSSARGVGAAVADRVASRAIFASTSFGLLVSLSSRLRQLGINSAQETTFVYNHSSV